MNTKQWQQKKARIPAWFHSHRQLIINTLLITITVVIGFYGICVALSYKAADIFNSVVDERQLFPGTVTVERISATPSGEVSFEGLVWKSNAGILLANIPSGSFKVDLWDVVTHRIGTTTLKELTINQGYVHLYFSENMELLNINDSTRKHRDPGEKRDKKNNFLQITGANGNRKFNCKVNILDGSIEAESPRRHFLIDNVNLKSDIHTGAMTKIDFAASHFKGTVAATGITLGGTLDFSKNVPDYNMYLVIKDCNPKSLNVGIDIDNKASVYATIKGSLPRPIIDGTLTFEKLDITALNFINVKGAFHYEDGVLDAKKVTASVYDGDVEASGQFDLDEKSYHADIYGKRLKGGVAANDMMFKCRVDLELHMAEDKREGTKEIYGSFASGPGRYHILPFDKISGSFEQNGKILYFKNVVISLAMGDITTDAFSIVNGKVHLGPIYVENENGRSRLR